MLTQKKPTFAGAVTFHLAVLTAVLSGCSDKADTGMKFAGKATYALTAGCGNGVLEPELGETCDDGNITGGDGCGASCTVEAGFVCVGERPSLCSPPDQSDAPASYGLASHGRSLPPVSPFVGHDFYTAFPLNLGPPTALALKIAGTPGATGSVTNYLGAVIANFTIPASGITTVQPTIVTYHITTNNAVTHQGVHITSTGDIRVLATNEHTATTDTWGVWDTPKLGTEYIVFDAATSSQGWEFVVVGTAANTAVTVRNGAGVVQTTFTLNAGDTYQYANVATMVGWTVSATQPVALLSGTQCTNDVGAACDMTAEQLAPTRFWARDYAIAPTFGSNTAKANHLVIASQDNTTIIITASDGTQQTKTLNARQSAFIATATTAQLGYFLSSDKPIAVASNVGDPANNWDPSLVTWPPLDGYVSSAKMPTSGVTITYTNFLSIITRTAATANITVNGAAVSGWTAISTTGYSFARVSVPNGDNTVDASNGVKFAAVATGGANYVSYGYSSPYDIATVGGSTNCYLGNTAPDYELPFSGSPAANQDDLDGNDDEDAFSFPTSVQLGAATVTLNVPCNDDYFGVDVTASVTGFIDFNRDGVFTAGEAATGACNDTSANTTGSATLTWTAPAYNGLGTTVARFRICDVSSDCTAPTGGVASGEVEDHLVHIGTCGDGFVDTFDACDDGNTTDGDGCSTTCTVESGFVCSGNPSLCLLNQAPAITSPANNTLLNTNTPAISGTCVSAATVRVREGSSTLCTATCVAGAFSCTTSAIGEGSHSLTADQQIGPSVSVPSSALLLRIDTVAPLAADLTSPVSGSATRINAVPVGGTCEPGASVQVKSDGSNVCSVVCALAGTFSCTTSALTDATHSLTAVQTDVGGNVSPASTPVSITVDTAAPAAPTITAPAAATDPGTATPTVTGACEAGATVKIVENLSTVICTTTCVGGAYSCVTSPLSIGSHTIQARETDAAGNQSPFSAQRTFPITSAVSAAPTITAPTEGGLLASATPAISLACTTGNPITVYEGSTVICTGTCAASAYSCTPTLSDGAHSVTATQTNGGIESTQSPVRHFTTDATAPAAPAITAPAPLSATSSTTPAISGSCETGAAVTVLEGATTLCTATCVSGGFSCASSPLALGGHTIHARQADAAGNLSPDSSLVTFGVAVCGNGSLELGEGCDDGNAAGGDGCSALCALEPGFSCPGAGTACQAVCGDGVQTSGEACDDGNTTSGDGCSASCVIEPGFLCGNAATNLVTNGGFDLGNTGFSSMLSYLGSGPNTAADQYGISTGNDWRPDVCTGVRDAEHSAANRSLYFNAGSDPTQVIYQTDVDVVGGADYIVEARAMSWASSSPPRLVISLGAAALTSEFTAVVCGANVPWTRIAATYHAPSTGRITLQVFDHETAGVGNDGALDAFSVRLAQATSCGHPTIAAPAAIIGVNASSYPLTGTCLAGTDVTLQAGAVQATVVCAAGAWSHTFDLSSLADGTVTFTATQSNASGSASASASASKDTIALAPVILTPGAAALLATSTPVFAGTCEPGADISVHEGAQLLCSAACIGGGFSCSSSPLSEGTHLVTAAQQDAAGNLSPDSAPVTLVIDTVAPLAPTITAPAAASVFNDRTPIISGACEALALVTLSEGARVLCTATCGAGAYTCQAASLADGTHTLVATQVDQAGNQSPAGFTSFTVDLTPPTAPQLTAPTPGKVTNDPTPALAGSCEPGALVTVYAGTATLCSSTCAGAGTFACDASTLGDGTYSIIARQTDPAGNLSPDSGPVSFRVDTQVSAPVITAPTAGAALSTRTPTISGTCEDGATVTVSESGASRCSATCSAGHFSCVSALLSEGPHTYSVSQLDLAGNQSTVATVAVTLDVTAPTSPTFDHPAAGDFIRATQVTFSGVCETAATVEVREGNTLICSAQCSAGTYSCTSATLPEGSHAFTVRQRDPAGNTSVDSSPISVSLDVTAPAAPLFTSPAAASTTGDSTPHVSGTCEAYALVEVFEGATLRCSGTCTTAGAWGCDSSAIGEGAHTFTARQTDRAGNLSVTSSLLFTVDTTPPVIPHLTRPAASTTVADSKPVFAGTAEPSSTVVVRVDGLEVCRAIAAADGSWTCAPATALADGHHVAQLIGIDPTGNTSAISNGSSFAIDTVAPRTPSILAPAPAQLVGAWPTFSGHGEPGSTVDVKVDGAEQCTALVDTTGSWGCLGSTALSTGAHSAVATASDPVGNTSAATKALAFTVSGSAVPGAPVLTSPPGGSASALHLPQFTGHAEPGATISIKLDGILACATTADAQGAFSCSSSISIPDGPHSAFAWASNGAGAGQPSGTVHFFIDTVAPDAPALTAPAANAVTGSRPLFGGTSEAGAEVTVHVDGSASCTTKADARGRFACFLGVPLAPGAHAAVASAKDLAGNLSASSAATAFTVGAEALPAAPLISAPAEAAVLASSTVPVSGKAEPGSHVQVLVDGLPACDAIASDAGDWACTVTGVGDGLHALTATTTNRSGTSPSSFVVDLTVDTIAPPAPVITAPAHGAAVSLSPQFVGTAEPGSTVHVFVDGQERCVTIAATAGDFSCSLATPLAEGSHTVTATAFDAAGLESPGSASVAFTASTQVPTITSPAAEVSLGTGKPLFAGTAAAGTTVRVAADGHQVCEATADAKGAWACTPAAALADGPHSAQATSDNGYGTSKGSALRSFTVDTTAPASPVVISPKAGAVDLLGSNVVFTGTAEPGSTVRVFIDGALACSAQVNASGAWTCTATGIDGARHEATSTATDKAGNTSGSTTVIFTNVTKLVTPSVSSPAAGATVSAPDVTFSGSGTPGTTATVIDETGRTVCTATVDASGAWSCSGTETAGPHQFTSTVSWNGASSTTSTPIDVMVVENAHFAGGIGCSTTSGSSLALLGLALAALTVRRRREVR